MFLFIHILWFCLSAGAGPVCVPSNENALSSKCKYFQTLRRIFVIELQTCVYFSSILLDQLEIKAV
jgi:hypothetical protein